MNTTMTELLYQHYSLDSIKYVIDMHLELVNSLDNILSRNDPLREKKISIFRYEVFARFTHLAESLGSLLFAFYNLKKGKTSFSSMTNDHAQQILQSISEYKVGAIPKF